MLPDDPNDQARFFYLALLGIAIAAGLFHAYRARLGTALQHAAIWLLIILGLVLAYGFKDRLVSELMPGAAAPAGEGAIALRRAADGHFYARAEVNGAPIRFLVDTGASSVVLTREDASRAGLDPGRLSYTRPASTANGTVMGAPVTLDRVELGGVAHRDVRALVNGSEMRGSLLGMSYLDRFRRFSVEGDTLILAR
jgi:aspartyl protease family protein